ncbi:hypothetical protein V1225_12005 [Emergencia sp. JLR.KK010]|uniref:hypothetical protein n=1 Tax=Emergencia sp. JLR.KK010 TaxID=3114296 RepID=UPI0030D563B1
MMDYKWIRPDMDLYYIGENEEHIITVTNSGILEVDFYKYAQSFYEAAETVIHYLGEEAAENHDIAKLDLWYFATVYLYRQSLELLLKASIFQTVMDVGDRKDIVAEIRHDLKQSFEKLIEIKGLAIDENENAKWVMDYLSDISRIDKESDMFRYPFGSNFKALFDKQTHISLVATHDNMNKAYTVIKETYDTGAFPTQDYESYSPQLIIEGGHYYQQSVVGYKYSRNSFYPYFSSYSEVGNFLKDKIIMQKKCDLFMPMCYLYRNAVELGLKRVIVEDSHIDNSKIMKITRRKKHSILGLWNSIADEIREYANAPDDDTTLEDTQQYIQTFHDFDQSSDLFRYPCNKNMDSYFLDSKKFAVENVASCFEELCNFLDAVDSMLSEIKDYEAEMASYYDYY